MFQPALLEYSTESLSKKLQYLNSNIKNVKLTCKSLKNSPLKIHVDVINKQFAIDTNVLESLGFTKIFKHILFQNFKVKNILFTCHFMQNSTDLKNLWDYVNFIEKNKKLLKKRNYKFEFYISPLVLTQLKTYVNKLSVQKLIKVGIWLDLPEIEQPVKKASIIFKTKLPILLMCVKAGRSGQIINEETFVEINKILTKVKSKNILLDGGLNFQNYQRFIFKKHLSYVVYSAFWQKIKY